MNEENEQMNDATVNETAQNTADNYRYICTMDNSTFEGKRAIVNARNSALSLNGHGAEPLALISRPVSVLRPVRNAQTSIFSERTVRRISVSHRESTAACWIFTTCSPISTRRTALLLPSSRPHLVAGVPRNRLKSSSPE